jgi:hypothetical protein
MIFKENVQLDDQRGVILVMSMMILLVMITSVIALTQVVFGEIKMTRNADNSIVAFYAAESGIERGLYYLKFSKEQNDFTYFDRLIDPDYYIETPATYYNRYDISLEGRVIFNEATTTVPYYEIYDVSTSTPARVDIVKTDGVIPTAATTLPQSFKVEWDIYSCEDGHASDQMEITYTSLQSIAGVLKSDTKQTIAVCGCAAGNDSCTDILRTDIENDKFYYFTFRPLDDTVDYIKFTSYLGANHDLDTDFVPAEAFLQAYGYYRQSMHSISVRVPIYTPVSNVFSYVIFSEQDLEKGFTP